jgi:hypothetical protein
MLDQGQQGVTNEAQIDFPLGRVVGLLAILLILSLSVMGADLLGLLPQPV